MAKAKQTKTTADPNAGRLIMPDLQWMETPEEKAEAQKAAGTDANAQLKALQDQIAALKGDLENQSAANRAMMAQPLVQAAPQAPKMDMTNLPDPTLEPEAYASEVARRTTAYIGQVEQQRAAAAGAAQSETRRVDALWEDFTEKYPQYADKNDQVEYVATKLAQRAAARGLDVNKYVFGASGVFMSDVAKEMEKVFGKADTDTEAEDDEPDNRTAGLAGGQESGGRAVKPDEGPRSAFAPGSMFGGIQDWQAKTGFTR
jgi:hypothetical protein